MAAAVVLVVAPGIASARSEEARGKAIDHDHMTAEGMAVQHTFIELYNGRKWEQLGALYLENAIAVPPNHEPILGRAAIVEYWRGVRDTLGEAECGDPLEVTASGKLVALVSRTCSAYAGRIGFTTHELYERQPDGSLRYKFDMFGMR